MVIPPYTPFELSGGHPALDLVNTLDDRFHAGGPKELLNGYDDLLRFGQQTQLLTLPQVRLLSSAASPAAAASAVRAARQLREALAATLYRIVDSRPPRADDLRILERHIHAASRHAALRWQGAATHPGRGALAWQRDRFEREALLPVWLLAQAAGELLLSPALGRVSACGAETCRWLFLDTSKNHTRRWCNMKVCGNRTKARRFQARHGASQGSEAGSRH
jgi:predicted RNA-binding Zn ribbon-like protein